MCEFRSSFVFPTSQAASMASNALTSESSIEKRVHERTLHVCVREKAPRDLQRSLNGLLEQLQLIVRVLGAFDIVD